MTKARIPKDAGFSHYGNTSSKWPGLADATCTTHGMSAPASLAHGIDHQTDVLGPYVDGADVAFKITSRSLDFA